MIEFILWSNGLQWRISRGRKVWMKGERLEWWPNGGCLCVWACQMWWSQSKGDGGSGRGEEFKFLLKLNRNNDYWTVRRKPEKERGVQQSECTPQDAKCWDVFLLKWWVCVAQTAISVAASKIGCWICWVFGGQVSSFTYLKKCGCVLYAVMIIFSKSSALPFYLGTGTSTWT